LQFLAGFEAHSFPWRNAYFRARPGITADSGLAGFYVKDTKTAKFNAVISGQSLLHGLEDGLDRDFRLCLGDTSATDDVVNDIQLYQTNLLKIQVLILESGFGIVKNFLRHYDAGQFSLPGRFGVTFASCATATKLKRGYSNMPVKNDRWIRKMALEHDMIKPFVESQVRQNVISYGVSSYGYDLRVADEFKIFTNVNCTVVDPKHFDERAFVEFKGPVCIIPPNSFALSRSVEYFKIPRSVLTVCVGKSSYARCGIIVNVTPLEPEWEGFVTLEISNTAPLPACVYANEGLCQIIFLESDELCETSYKDKKGKYQAQKGIVLPRV
jgi:dCTP deaminase